MQERSYIVYNPTSFFLSKLYTWTMQIHFSAEEKCSIIFGSISRYDNFYFLIIHSDLITIKFQP